jgi:hypothetical protein
MVVDTETLYLIPEAVYYSYAFYTTPVAAVQRLSIHPARISARHSQIGLGLDRLLTAFCSANPDDFFRR